MMNHALYDAVCLAAVAGVASAETREAIPDRYYNTFSHANPIFLRINAGDIVATKTLDSGGMDDHGQLQATGGGAVLYRKCGTRRRDSGASPQGAAEPELGLDGVPPGSILGPA